MLIGTRLLRAGISGGTVEVPVHLYLPVFSDRAWSCRFEIEWPDGTRSSEAWGIDALQAVHMAMQKIAAELYMSPYHKQGLLSWGQAGGYGFPITKNGRDLLVGYDKEFDG
jgi:hypothetical protein